MTINRGSVFRACPIKSAFTGTWQRFNGIQFRAVGKLYCGEEGGGRFQICSDWRLLGRGGCHLTWWGWGRGHILFSLIHPQLEGRMKNSEAWRHCPSPECSGSVAAELVDQSFVVMYDLVTVRLYIQSFTFIELCWILIAVACLWLSMTNKCSYSMSIGWYFHFC